MNVLTPRSAKASEARKVLQGSWRDLLARIARMTIKLPIIEMITTKKKINPMEEKLLIDRVGGFLKGGKIGTPPPNPSSRGTPLPQPILPGDPTP